MQPLRRSPSACLLIPALVPLLFTAAGCPNSVGITCPKGQPWCDVIDMSPPVTYVDAALPLPDLATCAAACPKGCCDDKGVCHDPPKLDACGKLGASCVACDPDKSDNCKFGGCGCGPNPACGDGSRCVSGACVCDETSCLDGCCGDGGKCWKLAIDHCGPLGGACGWCDAKVADGCLDGCSCGQGPPCVDGQHCEQGKCVCDGTSCPGCCAGTTCIPPSLATCGYNGAACTTCDPTLADHCGPIGCKCGGNPACMHGQRCENGNCICDAVSCPVGCCYSGFKCLAGNTLQACGVSGGACQACTNTQTCIAGACVN